MLNATGQRSKQPTLFLPFSSASFLRLQFFAACNGELICSPIRYMRLIDFIHRRNSIASPTGYTPQIYEKSARDLRTSNVLGVI